MAISFKMHKEFLTFHDPTQSGKLIEGTSDMNVLNYVHGEYLSMKVPENISQEAAVFFQK